MGIRESYTSASALPAKLLHMPVIDGEGKIRPIHIQLTPTNACNLNCEFCSCSDVDKSKSLSYEQMMGIIDTTAKYGGKAMTITGGGEPLLHPRINDVIKYGVKYNMKAGLVTNGTTLNRLQSHTNLTWCRISCSDDRIQDYNMIKAATEVNPDTDWAFSYVVTRNPDFQNINNIVEFANRFNFSHVRLVSDLHDLANVPDMDEIEKRITEDDSKVIYQGRKESVHGTKNCSISLLKPVIAPEGIFPCCGAQYAIHGQEKALIDDMKMGEVEDLERIILDQESFDGSNCDVCYYSQYNDALSKLLIKPDHVEFV